MREFITHCERIFEMRPDIPVLFMSGYSADIIAEKGILEGAVHFIQKPFTLQKLSLKDTGNYWINSPA